jgi:hypothetical protein
MPFFLNDSGQLCLRQKKDHTTLSTLPSELRSKIWNSFLEVMSTVGVDLDTTAGFTTQFTMLYVNRSMRLQCGHVFIDRSPLLVLSSTSARVRFSNTAKIERLFLTDVDIRPKYDTTSPPIIMEVGMSLNLHFKIQVKLDKLMKLEGLRIDILPFLLASAVTWDGHPVTIALDTPNCEQQEFVVTLELLRRRVLATLEAYRSEHVGATQLCPDVWVDGYGFVKEVIADRVTEDSTGHSTVENTELDAHDDDPRYYRQTPYPIDHRLGSTVQYLGWIVRYMEKESWYGRW